jgi:hypothetical protein
MSRAIVFAGATLASAASCGGKAKAPGTTPQDPQSDPQNDPQYDVHPDRGCVESDPKRAEELEKQKETAQTDEERAEIDRQLAEARAPTCMPYGAPPRRHRIV